MKIYRAFCALIMLAACQVSDMNIGGDYLGVPYVGDPLGEGMGYDPDPLIRTDAFDCTTFVETALAHGDLETLNQIRYANGHINFISRNHFIETDWLTHNAARVRDISDQIAPTAQRTVYIDRANWMQRVHGIETDDTPKVVNLSYIPYDRWPMGYHPKKPVIVLFITDGDGMREKIGTDLAVVHMGFLMPDGMLRHASSRGGRVMDENFDDYVAARQKSRHNLGVMIWEIK